MNGDDLVLPCIVDGCKQPAQMPASEYCLSHGASIRAPRDVPGQSRAEALLEWMIQNPALAPAKIAMIRRERGLE